MGSKKVAVSIFNPALGILPLILFMAITFFVPISAAFLIGIISYVVCIGISLLLFRNSPSYMLIISGIIMILYFLASVISPINIYQKHLPVIYEVFLVCIFSILKMFKRYISGKIRKNSDKNARTTAMIKLDEFFYISNFIRDAMIIHLLIILVYELLPAPYHSLQADKIIIPGLILTFFVFNIIFEYVRVAMLNQKMRSEEWLPIVNESGGVIGRVAFRISRTATPPYLHPLIRIALIYKGMLYLNKRPSYFLLDPNRIDYPFEKYVFFKHTLEEAIENVLSKGCGNKDLPVTFAFKYLYKNKKSNRLIYLYTCCINDEETMNNLTLNNGKLWTEKQIEENLTNGIFSECFEEEYYILKDTILMAEKLANPDAISN